LAGAASHNTDKWFGQKTVSRKRGIIMKIATLVLAIVLLSPTPTMAQNGPYPGAPRMLCGVGGCDENSRAICGVNPCDFHLQREESYFSQQMRQFEERQRLQQEADTQRYNEHLRQVEEQERREQEIQQMRNEQARMREEMQRAQNEQRLREEMRRYSSPEQRYGSSFDSPFR
jgi:hypothetical protein